MRSQYVYKSIGTILKAVSVCVIVPVVVALYYKEYSMIVPFVCSSAIAFLIGTLVGNKATDVQNINDIKKSEALFITVISWILFGLIATVPYLYYHIPVVDSFFEAFSGTTTTGVSVLENLVQYPKTILFWRSYTQWLGGMGIIVLFIAVLPQFAVAGRQMFSVEVPGPTEQKFTPRIRNTANFLWKVYFILTVVQIVILKALGMPFFYAVCNSLSTLSAGGFAPEDTSVVGYSFPILVTICVFMFISAMNFPLIYQAMVKKNPLVILKDEEFRFYLSIIAVISLIICAILFCNHYYNFLESLWNSIFHTVSILTTSSFVSESYWLWPLNAKMFLFLLYFVGGCAGSTAGGLKVVRVLFLFKFIKKELLKILHPNAVYNIKINKVIFPEEVSKQIMAFIIFYFIIFTITSFAIILIEENTIIGITGAISSLGNIGPGFGILEPFNSFAHLQAPTKIILIFNMVVGRLELIPFLAMLHPDFWNWKK